MVASRRKSQEVVQRGMSIGVVGFVFAVLAICAPPQAHAAVFTENVTLNANLFNESFDLVGGGLFSLQFVVPTVTLNVGDQYDLTVSFLAGQSITVTSSPGATDLVLFGDNVFGEFPEDLPSHANNPDIVTLLGVSGNPAMNPVDGSCGDCFWGAVNPLTNSAVSFTGVEFLGTANVPFTTTGQEELAVAFEPPSAVSINTAVPEPITLSLFGAGLVGAAATRRRKKAK